MTGYPPAGGCSSVGGYSSVSSGATIDETLRSEAFDLSTIWSPANPCLGPANPSIEGPEKPSAPLDFEQERFPATLVGGLGE